MKQKNVINIIISIIVFLIILFLLIGKFGIIEIKKPTGYVDIFDINFVFNCNCNCGGDTSKCLCSSNCSCKGVVLGVSDIWDDVESDGNASFLRVALALAQASGRRLASVMRGVKVVL